MLGSRSLRRARPAEYFFINYKNVHRIGARLPRYPGQPSAAAVVWQNLAWATARTIMDESEQLSRLIADIYDAALDPSLWESVLEKVCGFLPGGAAMLGIDDTTKKSVRLVVEWGNDPHFLQLHDSYYTRLNPMTVPTLLYAKPGSVLGSSDLVPYEELTATRFFREWIAPQGMVDALAIIIEKAPTSYAAVIVHRYRKHGRVDDAMKRRASLLAPHFQRAIAIGKLIDLHKVEAATMADALDGLSAGIFLIDSGIRVVQANRRGRTMLKERIHLGETDGRLCALDPAADRMLRNTVASAGGGDRAVGTRGFAIPLKKSNGEQYVAHVLPLTSGSRRLAGVSYSAVAAVFVQKADLDLPSPVETIARIYKLTAAEMRVLMATVQIGRIREIAAVLGLSVPTVKTHLRRLFEKTGTKRQADLIKLVAGYMSPIAEALPPAQG